MSEMEERMGAILNDPQMMQKIMAMAQSLQNQPAPEATAPPPMKDTPGPDIPIPDMAMLSQLSSIAGKSRIDNDQQSLLRALRPYLSSERIAKLERAMRAAKMASLASVFLGNSGLLSGTGR